METDTSGRVLPILGGSMLAPAVCLICRRPGSDVNEEFADPSELFADPQIHEDFFGSVYFCKNCAFEIAAIFGAQSNVEVEEAFKQRDNLLVEITVAHARIQELERTVDALSIARLSERNVIITSSGASVIPNLTTSQTEQDSHERLPELTEQRADESPESTESGSSERPDDSDESSGDDIDSFLRNL